jgi:hypothetical protein
MSQETVELVRRSGTPCGYTSWHVWRWRRRKAVWFCVFEREADALDAAEVRE